METEKKKKQPTNQPNKQTNKQQTNQPTNCATRDRVHRVLVRGAAKERPDTWRSPRAASGAKLDEADRSIE